VILILCSRCSTLSRNGADRQTFIDDKGRSINISDYYFKQYKIKLRFPSAPMIQVGTGKNIKYFPLELMRIAPRQPHRGQVDENMQVINFQDFLG
jgi:eukaryotic translation initiation factor 2C